MAPLRLEAAFGSDLWQLPEVGKQEDSAPWSFWMEDNRHPTGLGVGVSCGLKEMISAIPPNLPTSLEVTFAKKKKMLRKKSVFLG